MKAFLTIIGSLLLFSAMSQAEEKLQLNVDNGKQIFISDSQVVNLKNNSVTVKKILNKDLSEISKIPSSQKGLLMGGATSGGGDDIGLEVQRALSLVVQAIQIDSELYPSKVKQALLTKAQSVKILITEEALPAGVGKLSQYGAAFSVFDGRQAVILIQRQRWVAIDNPTIKDSLIHHELAVLAGLETTGDYQYTNLFATQRAKFWERLQSQSFVCTFSLYKKTNDRNSVSRKLMGSAGVFIGDPGVSSNFEVIQDLEPHVDGKSNRAIIVRYVLAGSGYLRAQISEADVTRYKNSSWKTFSNLSEISVERIYFSPYDSVDTGRGSNLETWGDNFLQVACSKM
ncbi:hypothetical protein [Bdellovibrio svalbardensis]|uniref:Uncharacterized protein n=1 Tax=Bdellovibrio svalbardensis TaxID=2972972 RepID=A0ABT6DM72_9BACT|nr:hypothetical protein [Bdellovibrio svalbardensis]MDG0817980.1 hypothetical protein [Bdellovibrio svalbardensis]